MDGMATNLNNPSIEALIAAAGMTAFAEDCDRIVVHARVTRLPIEPVFVKDSEVQPPFGD
jgi:hypothetical protein